MLISSTHETRREAWDLSDEGIDDTIVSIWSHAQRSVIGAAAANIRVVLMSFPPGELLDAHETRRATLDLSDEGIETRSINERGGEPNQYQGLIDDCALRAHASERLPPSVVAHGGKSCCRSSMSSASVVASPEKRSPLAFKAAA
jgi:hypothetical protein